MRYSLVVFLMRAIIKLIARITMYGAENIPHEPTSFIGVSNHIGRLDPALVFYLLNRRDIIMLVAEKYKEHAWSRWMAQAINGIFVDRYKADLGAMREVLRRLKKGGVVAMAPEGTRSPDCNLIQGWDGASFIAAKSGLPIIPVGVVGTCDREVLDRLKHFKRLEIELYIGAPFTLTLIDHRSRDEQLSSYTEEIMCHIAAQLPEAYRGIYANHPRLLQLLSKGGEPVVQLPKAVV